VAVPCMVAQLADQRDSEPNAFAGPRQWQQHRLVTSVLQAIEIFRRAICIYKTAGFLHPDMVAHHYVVLRRTVC
jgi:hypothetical protein